MRKGKGWVLIVDDEEGYRNSLKMVLDAGGYDVHLAENSQEALEFLKRKPDICRLTIVDWNLGKYSAMDGIELTREIKEKHPDVKIVELTSHGNKKLYDEALEAGAVRFVHKTGDPKEIIEILDSLAEMEELDHQLRKPSSENYWMHQIITECKSGISIIDRTYRVLFISKSLEEMSPPGFKPKVGGICWVEFHHNETQKEPCSFCPLKSWFEEGEPSGRGSTNLSPVGEGKELRYFDITGSPIRDKDGRIIGGVKILTDATERERLIQITEKADIRKELKEQLRVVLEGIQRLGNYNRLRVYILSDDMNRLEGLVEITDTKAYLDYSAKVELFCNLDEHFCYCDHMDDEGVRQCNSTNKKIGHHPLDPDLREWLQVSLIDNKKPMGLIEMDNKIPEKPMELIEMDNEIPKKPLSIPDSDLTKKYARRAAHLIAVAREIQGISNRADKAEKLNEELKKATQESIYTAALMAATLDLPINPNLGFAYLIPYKKHA
ncbi:MAG: response regulator, partial [Candidatus Desantisbacteria bacterium]